MKRRPITVLLGVALAWLMLDSACSRGPTPEQIAAAEAEAAAAAAEAEAAAAAAEAEAARVEAETAAEARLRQGTVFVNQGDFRNAINEFSAAAEISPSPEAYSNLGAAYMQTGKMNLAYEALQSAEKLGPEDANVLYNLTAFYSMRNDTDLALIYLDRSLTAGFANYDALRFDPDLENLRGEPEFRRVLEQHKVFIQ